MSCPDTAPRPMQIQCFHCHTAMHVSDHGGAFACPNCQAVGRGDIDESPKKMRAFRRRGISMLAVSGLGAAAAIGSAERPCSAESVPWA